MPGTLLVDAKGRKDGVLLVEEVLEGLEVLEFFEEVTVGLVEICDLPGFFDWASVVSVGPPWLLLWWL